MNFVFHKPIFYFKRNDYICKIDELKMQVLKNITAIILSVALLLSSHGFILERYLCLDCSSEHKEVAFFEFGELKHNHAPCTECADHGHVCDCSDKSEEHHENSEVEYIALDLVFVSQTDNDNTIIVPQINIIDLGIDLFPCKTFADSHIILTLLKQYKTPPLLSQFKSSADFCAILSIYRL